MKIPDRAQIEALKEAYPEGSRIRLLSMDDMQAPPPGTEGTAMGVDGIGQIMVRWDTGSSLSLVPGVDSFERVAPEEEPSPGPR